MSRLPWTAAPSGNAYSLRIPGLHAALEVRRLTQGNREFWEAWIDWGGGMLADDCGPHPTAEMAQAAAVEAMAVRLRGALAALGG